MTDGPAPTGLTIRNRFGIAWLVAVGLGVVILLVDVAVRGDLAQLLLVAPWMLLLVWLVVAFLVRPRLVADQDGVNVRNPLRSARFGWSEVADIESRWQIGFRLRSGATVQAFAAPLGRGRRSAPDAGADELALLQALREAAVDSEMRPTVRWNVDVLLVLAALVAWAAIAVAVTR